MFLNKECKHRIGLFLKSAFKTVKTGHARISENCTILLLKAERDDSKLKVESTVITKLTAGNLDLEHQRTLHTSP